MCEVFELKSGFCLKLCALQMELIVYIHLCRFIVLNLANGCAFPLERSHTLYMKWLWGSFLGGAKGTHSDLWLCWVPLSYFIFEVCLFLSVSWMKNNQKQLKELPYYCTRSLAPGKRKPALFLEMYCWYVSLKGLMREWLGIDNRL